MNRYLPFTVVMVLSALTSNAFSEVQANLGPGVIDLKNGRNALVFPHRNHQSLYKGQCSICHTAEGFKILNWGKERAHELCISCHAQKSHGPSHCIECHEN